MANKLNVEDLDVYEILKLPDECTTQDIKKAYRKAALECHPDKNPDDAKAAEKFIQLGAILKLLLEPHARKAYDLLRRARLQAKIRLEKQDSVRKKLREDLERRERESAAGKLDTRTTQEKLKAEVERLRKESSRQLDEEIEAMHRLVKEDIRRMREETNTFRLKLKWKRGASSVYDTDKLTSIFSKYGQISALVLSKKGGSALLEYQFLNYPDNLVENETGNKENPIQVTWVSGHPMQPRASTPPPPPSSSNPVENGGLDFEELVFQRLREAQKKQETTST